MTDAVASNTLAGRASGVHLNDQGTREMSRVTALLSRQEINAIYCSPLERTLESAQIIGEGLELHVTPVEEFTELELGDWTGRSVDELKTAAGWREYNILRSCTRIPRGETMLEIQARSLSGLLKLRSRHPSGRVVLVTHADVIKLVVSHLAGIPIDLMHRLTVDAGSISSVTLGDDYVKINYFNHVDRPDDF